MPLPPLSELTAALHIGHLTVTAGSTLGLSEALQRQIRHVSYEFMELKEEEFGPNSDQSNPHEWARATEHLMQFFSETRQRGMKEDKILDAAKLAETTLREIRALRGTDHFFSETLDGFFKGLALLGVDYEQFASALIWELHKYREQRDEEESRFLKPFHEYSAQLMGIVSGMASHTHFTHMAIENRIKRDLLSKLVTREWKHMQEFYDLVGLRIIVGNQREVNAAVALIEGALRVHESSMMLDPSLAYYFRVDHIEEKISVPEINPAIHVEDKDGYLRKSYNQRGYRGKHVNVRRHCRENGHNHPTAEIQVMSKGTKEWGDIQRLLIYKDDGIPKDIKSVICAYCRSAADYISGCENGSIPSMMPDMREDILQLNQIQDDALRGEVLDRLCDMDAKMGEYRKAAGGMPSQDLSAQISESTVAHH